MELENKEKYTLDKNGNIRFDYLFSDWIFIWFVIYFLASKTNDSLGAKYIYENMNPIIGLFVALFENIFLFILILIYNPNMELIFKFLLMMVTVKIIPIVLLQNTKIRFIENSLSLIMIFALYNVYLYIENTNIYNIYKNTTMSVIHNNNKTPFFRFYDYIVKIWKRQ